MITREQRAEKRRARYAERRAQRRCWNCGAGLPEEAETGKLCVECADMRAAASRRYKAKNPQSRGKTKPETRRRKYHAKKAARICVAQGCHEPAMRNCRMCRKHRHAHAGYSREYQRRKTAARREAELQRAA